MISLFKKQNTPTVEKIHAEIDSAESKILNKWGTDDDQSYLDESLTNEKLN